MGFFDRLKKSSEDRAFVVWHKKLDVPVFDNNRQLRIYSNTKLFESDYKRERNVFWGIPRDIIELKKIDDIPLFYNTMWIHYGCKNIVIDHNAPESLKDMITVDLTHFDKSVPDHEVSNPDFRMCTILFNMLTFHRLTANKAVLEALLNEYLSLLKSAELLLPFNPQDSSLMLSMNLHGSEKLIAFSSFEAIPSDIIKQGYTSCVMQKIDDLIEVALNKNMKIAININSPGGGVLITYDDMFKINGVRDIFDEAERCRTVQEYDKAVALYEQAARAGYNLAQNNLAVMLQNGTENIPADISKAIYWYEKAADTLAFSAVTLGRIYDVGEQVTQDLSKAAAYYSKAANLGNAQAMYNIGVMYIKGEGVEKNATLGMDYLSKAAKLGDSRAISAIKALRQ